MRMHQRASLLSLLALTLLLLPAAASAQRGGFFLRTNLGAGGSVFSSDLFELNGPSGVVTLDIGAHLSRKVVVFGEIFGSSISDPTLKAGTLTLGTLNNATATLAGFGVGVGLYNRSDFFFGGTVGVSSLTYEPGTAAADVSTDTGPALSLVVGKEWPVADKVALGVSAHVMAASMKDQGGTPTWSASAVGIAFSFTFASGGVH